MEPWLHYVPIDYHFNNIIPIIKWAQRPENDERIREIIRNCQVSKEELFTWLKLGGSDHGPYPFSSLSIQILADSLLSEAGIVEYAIHVLEGYVQALPIDYQYRPRYSSNSEVVSVEAYIEAYMHLEDPG